MSTQEFLEVLNDKKGWAFFKGKGVGAHSNILKILYDFILAIIFLKKNQTLDNNKI